MPLCKLSKEIQIEGVTPVDNIFIAEIMPSAPSDYVKVYIYALMQCYMNLECDCISIAHDLNLEEKTVDCAFSYWERKGAIKMVGACYQFMPVKNMVALGGQTKQQLNTYKSFNNALTEIMEGRALKGEDFSKAYDWIEILGMSQECVLAMVHYAVTQKYKVGNKVSFNTLDKLAMTWADKGIKTAKQAKEYINAQIMISSDAKTILNHIGQYRNPTVDEYNLVLKWTDEYGFDIDTIINCCAEMTYSKNPSFALLDKIIEKYHDKGIISSKDIENEQKVQSDMHKMYKEINERCGGYGNVSAAQKNIIDGLLDMGFNKQGLIYICDYCVQNQRGGIGNLEKMAIELNSKNIIDENDICEYLDYKNEIKNNCIEFLETAGFKRFPSAKDIESYENYYSYFKSHEIMKKAAYFASKASNKTKHLALVLETWKNNHITKLDDVKDVIDEPENNNYIKGNENYSVEYLFDL